MQEEDFLRAIRRQPDDDATRLVFADWLDEQGDLQAEFIRLQCELEQFRCETEDASSRESETAVAGRQMANVHEIDSASPLSNDNITNSADCSAGNSDDNWQPLKQREQELSRELRQICLEDLATLHVRDVRFCRGFVEDLRVDGERFLQHGRLISRWAPALRTLRWRRLPRASGPALSTLMRSPFFSCLQVLDLNGTAPGRSGLAALAESKRLSRLRQLSLSQTFLAGQGMQELARSPHLSSLQQLDLADNELSIHDLQAFSGTASLRQLKRLNLAGNHVGDRGIQLLAQAPPLSTLRVLNVRGNEIGVLGLKAIADSPRLTDLTTLDLSNNEFGSAGIQYLASAANYGRLCSLRMADCELNSRDVETLAASPYLKRLQSFDLSGNSLQDGVRPLGTAANFQGLRELILRRCGLDKLSLRVLLDNDFGPALTRLDLRDNRLIDSMAVAALKERFGPVVQV